MRTALAALVALAALPLAASGQTWKEIGKTNSGNKVFVQPSSIKRGGDTVTVISEVRFTKPVADPTRNNAMIEAVRAKATFNCVKDRVAVKENTYYGKNYTVLDHSVPKIPGYGPIIAGALPAITRDYVCPKLKKS